MNYNRINEGIFDSNECDHIIGLINQNPKNEGFGIRYFIRDNPKVLDFMSHSVKFKKLVGNYFEKPVVVKSIYFDKPPKSNWPVNWHQDITINLKKKVEDERFTNWRILKDRVVAQPNIELLQSILTFRIHLDKTNVDNGALSLIDDSEEDGIMRINEMYLSSNTSKVSLIEIDRGGVMIMSPLTVHSSRRSKSNRLRRRVIHLEIATDGNMNHLPFVEYFEL